MQIQQVKMILVDDGGFLPDAGEKNTGYGWMPGNFFPFTSIFFQKIRNFYRYAWRRRGLYRLSG